MSRVPSIAGVVGLVLLNLFASSCARKRTRPPRRATTAPSTRPADLRATHLRVGRQELGRLPNSGLALPVVSPDGTSVACLDLRAGVTIDPRMLATGRDSSAVFLVMRPTRPKGTLRRVGQGGSTWPCWSPDGDHLLAVRRGLSGNAELAIHDLNANKTRRIASAFRYALTPAVSPSGRWLAVAGFASDPTRPRVYVVQPGTGTITAEAPEQADSWHLWPQWLDDRTLVYLACRGRQVTLTRWTVGRAAVDRLGAVACPPEAMDALQVFAALPRPLGPGGQRLAVYDGTRDAIVLMDLAAGTSRALKPRTRAGCWIGPRHFVAATDKDLWLVSVDDLHHARLAGGAWLPLWADAATNEILLCTRGSDQWTFRLARMKVIFDD